MTKLAEKTTLLQICLLIVLLFTIGACRSGSVGETRSPVTPGINNAGQAISSTHYLWGYWQAHIPATHDSIEFTPLRGTEFHFNARRLLEVIPCTDCLKLVGLDIDISGQTLTAEIQIEHPYPGLTRFTGFDIRAVVISDGSQYYPGLDATVPDADSGDFTLIEPDGYTRLWNTLEFPEGSGPFQILEYSQGNLASPGDFTGTVNPYISYGISPRLHFPPGEVMTREFLFKLVPGSIEFGYAIDASWEPPTVNPPVEIMFDFPSSANALEPYFSYWNVTTVPCDIVGSNGAGTVSMFDCQGWNTVQAAYLECPDLWTGVIEAVSIDYVASTTGGDALSAYFTFYNEFGAPAGDYPALLKVVDSVHDYWLGDINHMYMIISIPVQENQEPQFDGEMVYCAPGPPGPSGEPGTNNIFHLDLETMVETQITSLTGIGASVGDPRLNPQGTHILYTAGPSGYYSKIIVKEFPGSTSETTEGPQDRGGDFHPDGEHILYAYTSVVFGEHLDLYTAKYDATEVTHLAFASDQIRNARWSPDGSRIVMTRNFDYTLPDTSELWIYDVASEQFTQIMAADGLDDDACWSPVMIDGRYLIAFSSTRDHLADNEHDIYVIDPDTEEILCHLDTGVSEYHPSFSPDGLSFVFSMIPESESDSELFIYSWQTDEMFQLTDDDTYDSSPSWGWNW